MLSLGLPRYLERDPSQFRNVTRSPVSFYLHHIFFQTG